VIARRDLSRRAVFGWRGACKIIRRGSTGILDGVWGTVKSRGRPFDTGHVPRAPVAEGPNVRGQMAAHGENLREFLRIFDVFPRNLWGSATIFTLLPSWPILPDRRPPRPISCQAVLPPQLTPSSARSLLAPSPFP
jgi:hypothetical protein